MPRIPLRPPFLALAGILALAAAQPATAESAAVPAAGAKAGSAATLKYRYGREPEQFGELWLPNDYETHPVAVLVHGGCWSLPAGLGSMRAAAEALRDSGYAVWNLEFRRIAGPGGGYPGTFLDIANGIDFLRRIKDAQKLDLDRLVLVGHSTGGHLALWAAGRAHIKPGSKLYLEKPLPVKAVVSLGGMGDLAAFRSTANGCGHKRIDYLVNMAQRGDENYFADTSPASLLPLNTRQLLFHAATDPMLPRNVSLRYAKKARDSGDTVEYFTLKGVRPRDLIDPKSEAWPHVKKAIDEQLK
jgi:acetyl esterase/lipase